MLLRLAMELAALRRTGVQALATKAMKLLRMAVWKGISLKAKHLARSLRSRLNPRARLNRSKTRMRPRSVTTARIPMMLMSAMSITSKNP